MIKLSPYPSRRVLRRMGFLRDQKGIINRYFRESANWDVHMGKSQRYILDAVRRMNARRVALLGSGWLLDIPVETLAAECEQVYLIDIVHPPQIIHRIESMDNVTPVQADVTGGWISFAYELQHLKNSQEVSRKLSSAPENRFSFNEKVDCWVSVNILDQLDSLICEYLEGSKHITAGQLSEIRASVQDSHLGFLAAHEGVVITDVREIRVKEGKREAAREVLHVPLPRGSHVQTWTWIFDTQGTYLQGYEIRYEIIAMQL